MAPRPIALALLVLAPVLAAQEHPNGNRFGLSFGVVSPQGSGSGGFGTGYQAGMQIHFNRESPFMGRLRIDYTVVDSKDPVFDGVAYGGYPDPSPVYLRANVRREGYGLAYEFLPHFGGTCHHGAFAILGVGGLLWNERRERVNSPFAWDHHSRTESKLSFTPSVGLGYRFNPHVTVEARLVGSFLSVGPNLLDEQDRKDDGERHHLTFGTSLRF